MIEIVHDNLPLISHNESERQENYKRISLIATSGCYIVLTLISFIVALVGSFNAEFSSISDGLTAMSVNFEGKPILDLRFEPKGNKCPEGYEQEKLGEWGGSGPGCYCRDRKPPR